MHYRMCWVFIFQHIDKKTAEKRNENITVREEKINCYEALVFRGEKFHNILKYRELPDKNRRFDYFYKHAY